MVQAIHEHTQRPDICTSMHSFLKERLPGVKVVLLNSTLLDHARRGIIELVKKRDCARIILVTTQVVEAGMDLDFDFVVRDLAPIECIEQVRGRCNREMRKKSGNVYIIELSRGNRRNSAIYSDHAGRVDLTRRLLSRNTRYSVEDIDAYYEDIVTAVNEKSEDDEHFNETDNMIYYHQLRFDGQRRFKARIIDNVGTASFFIETDIDKKWFSTSQVRFLEGMRPRAPAPLMDGSVVRGTGMLALYKAMINESRNNKIVSKMLASIMARFITSINIFFLKKVDRRMDAALEKVFGEKVGFFHVITAGMIAGGWYSVETGFDKDKMESGIEGYLL